MCAIVALNATCSITIYLSIFKTISFFYDDNKSKLDFILGYQPFILGYGIFVQKLFWDILKINSGIRDICNMGYWVPCKQALSFRDHNSCRCAVGRPKKNPHIPIYFYIFWSFRTIY